MNSKFKKVLLLIAVVAMAGIMSGCSLKQNVPQEKQTTASAKKESGKTRRRVKRTSAAAAKKHRKGKRRMPSYGSEEYNKIPEKMKDKAAYAHIDEKTLRYNSKLVRQARKQIVIVPAK